MRTAPARGHPSTNRRRTLAMLIAGALAVAACGGDSSDQAVSGAASQAPAPETTAPAAPVVQAISGSQVDFADVLTQDTVLWFWAPW